MSQPIGDDNEVLFRQIHPSFVEKDGKPSSQPFRPTEKDANKLSVDRSSLTDAQSSHSLFTSNGNSSAAVYGLTVKEFTDEGLSSYPDPTPATKTKLANLAHAYADYSKHTSNKQKNISKRLKQKALSRGVLFEPKSQ